MRYIDKIKKMNADELAKSLKTLTDLMMEHAIKEFSKKHGIKTDFKSKTKVEDFKFCLLSEVE